MAVQLVIAQDAAAHGRNIGQAQATMPWLKLYVGDEYEKDVAGARSAGWNPVFVGVEEEVIGPENVSDLDQLESKALEEVFQQESPPLTIRTGSPQKILKWLVEQYGERH